jgi:hypothetical protein
VLTTVRGARLEGYLTGNIKKPEVLIEKKDGDKIVKITNPSNEDWLAID